MRNDFFLEKIGAILRLWTECDYDHRPYLPDLPHLEKWQGDELYRRTYAAFKFSVAAVLQPRAIIEIGVGFAVAARAFLAACPEAWYEGYDDGSMDGRSIEAARRVLGEVSSEARIKRQESSQLLGLPNCDLCHVDGNHDFAHAYHDTSMALRSARWVLVDDCHDSQVAAAVMQAVYGWRPGDVCWTCFENTHGGDILIWTGK